MKWLTSRPNLSDARNDLSFGSYDPCRRQRFARKRHLFTSLNENIDRLVDKVDTLFDGFRDDTKEVSDRLTRIEAQDQPSRLVKLEADLKDASHEIIASRRKRLTNSTAWSASSPPTSWPWSGG